MRLQVACDYFLAAFLLTILVGVSDTEGEYTTRTSHGNGKLPRLTIPQGTLQGINLASRHNRSFAAFLGIPYAQPPIGKLRFSSPVPAKAWTGTLNASVESSACPQPGNVGKEDCLYLNVYTPVLPKSHECSLLPVMVYIHGGAFEMGHGGPSLYGPNHLLDANVVLVSMNYRLGPLGFFSTGDEVASGNWGMKDQVLALRWVQKNIRYFGGDPDQVTIFGQSAGGVSVQLLALSESTNGLFHRFISQSGSALADWAYRPRSFYGKVAQKLGEILGCPTKTSCLLVDCLRNVNVSDIINTRSQFIIWQSYPLILWGPTDEEDSEGAFLTDDPENIIAAGKIRNLPSMTGMLKDDAVIVLPGPLPSSEVFKEFLNNFDELLPIMLQYAIKVEDVPSFIAAIRKFYFNDDLTTNRTQVWSKCVDLITDDLFIYPGYRALQKQYACSEHPPFFYSFDYRGTFSYGNVYHSDLLKDRVVHSDELIYLFPQIGWLFGAQPDEMSATDQKMIDTMVWLWTSFAIHGTPRTTGTISNTTWLPYSSRDNYLRIGNGPDPRLELRFNFLPKRMQFWKKLNHMWSKNAATTSCSRN